MNDEENGPRSLSELAREFASSFRASPSTQEISNVLTDVGLDATDENERQRFCRLVAAERRLMEIDADVPTSADFTPQARTYLEGCDLYKGRQVPERDVQALARQWARHFEKWRDEQRQAE
jgi:hypothetical protein